LGASNNLFNAGNMLLKVNILRGKAVLVPFVEAIVPEVELEEGWLLLTPPPGLLEL
jgi:16S rRNA processing protein RimM